jgi:1-acyl-sn-glycerol-3-phosphate acyltransferase
MRSVLLWVSGLFSFSLIAPVFVLSFILFSRRTTYGILRFLFTLLVRVMGISLTVQGRENVIPGRTYLIMGNHQSLFDVFVIPAAVPVPFVGLEADYHFAFPVWGPLIRLWGNIPIQRENLARARESIAQAEKQLKRGMSIGVLPEGHRTRSGRIGPFKKGPFHLALKAGADILPLGVRGLFDYCPKGSLRLVPGRVRVVIGEPIPWERARALGLDGLRDHLRQTIRTLAGEPSRSPGEGRAHGGTTEGFPG